MTYFQRGEGGSISAGRLVHLLLLLETRERVSARELASALEVSVRTVHRDIDALSRAGIAVYAERGRLGGFRLLSGRRFQITALTESEASALPLTRLPAIAAQLGLAEPAGAAWLKVESSLPPEQRERARTTAQHLFVDLTPPHDSRPVARQLLRGLWSAIERRRTLSLRLRGADGHVSIREGDPLGLVWHGYVWHLVLRERGHIVSVAIDTIELARATGETFDTDPAFVLERWWR